MTFDFLLEIPISIHCIVMFELIYSLIQPHIQGMVVAWAQEGREELLHVQGQEGRW